MAARKYVYFSEIERFGYTLRCIGRTEDEVRNAMIEEYVKNYKATNDGADPRKAYELIKSGVDETDEYEIDASYYETFLEELYVDKVEFGNVKWA